MKKVTYILIVFSLLMSIPNRSAYADVAPPETVPGSNINPESESTQVRMVAESVTLTISEDLTDENGAVAETRAVFTMRNLGTVEESMAVRFPLSFLYADLGGFPEIESIVVKVDGKTASTKREIQPFKNSEIPWAVFDLTFPPGQDVLIEVVYNVDGYGYYPYQAFKYILETGAGWNGTIGSAEIIVRLPYEVSEQNLDLSGQAGHGETRCV